MKRSGLQKYLEDFNKNIDYAIKECSRKTGITDLETVYRFLKKSSKYTLQRLKAMLADQQIRVIIQKRLKHCTVSVQEAAAEAAQDAVQVEFDFFEMEQFRGVRNRITYPEGEEMKYVEYNRSHKWQRQLSIAHLDAGIMADVARRDAEIASDKFLDPLVERFGDLEAEELARLWLRDQQSGTAGGV